MVYSIEIFQQSNDFKKFIARFSDESNELLNEFDLKVFAIEYFIRQYELYSGLGLHLADMRKFIFLTVRGNKRILNLKIKKTDNYIETRLSASDIAFKLSDGSIYILSYQKYTLEYKPNQSSTSPKLSYNIHPILNSVAFQNYKRTKVFSPIIYTGMKN